MNFKLNVLFSFNVWIEIEMIKKIPHLSISREKLVSLEIIQLKSLELGLRKLGSKSPIFFNMSERQLFHYA